MTDSTWGSATWGTATWGDADEVIEPVPDAPLEWRNVLLEGTDASAWPRGIEAVIHFGAYGEFILNDRRRLARHGHGVVIDEITGLDGPDLQVDNQKSPDRDGEYPDIPSYGGRTITLRGYVTALNVDRMRHLYSRIMDGFDYVKRESPLWFRWLDWRDNFITTDSLLDYEYDDGSGTLTVAADGTGLQPTSTAMKSLHLHPTTADGSSPSRLTYGDGEAIVGFQAAAISGNQIGVEARRTAANMKLLVTFNHSGGSAAVLVYAIWPDETLLLDTIAVEPTLVVAGRTYFFKVRLENSEITFSIWDFFPPDRATLQAAPLFSGSHTLSGDAEDDFPGLASGQGWGLRWTPNSTADRIQVFDVGAIDKGDAVIFCRKATKIEGPETQEGLEFRRTFLLTLRASDSRMMSRKVSRVTIVPPEVLESTTYVESEVTNIGRSPASVIVRFNGPVINPRLEILNQGVIAVEYDIPEDEYIEVDTRRHTAVNQVRASRYSVVSDSTDWPELGPVTNVVRASSELYDDFDDAADESVLNGRVSSGETWTTLGDSPDFTANASGEMARSTETDTVAGRKALFGSEDFYDTNILMRYRFDPDEVETGFVDFGQGLIARYIDANNFLYVSHGERELFIGKAVAGVGSYMMIENVSSIVVTLAHRPYTWLRQRLVVGSDGYGYVVVYDDKFVPVVKCLFYDADLKIGGALEAGRVGIFDRNGDGPNTRLYDDFHKVVALASGSIDIDYRHSSR